MTAATITEEIDVQIPGIEIVKLTTTGTTSTFQSRKFAEIVGCWGTNTSDDDGVALSWSGTTVTIVVGTSADVIYLMIAGRK